MRKWNIGFVINCTLLYLLAIGFSGCNRRDISYDIESEITVDADWSQADLEEEHKYGATLIIYPQDNSKPRIELMGNRTRTTFRLPRGRYNIILFNRSFNDFSSVVFRGVDHFETVEAYARQVETRAGTRVITSSPEKLATAVIRDFNATSDACNLHFVPQPLTRKVKVKLNINGLNNVRQARCTIGHIPLSVFLADNRLGDTTGRQEFAVGNPVFDEGSLIEGTLDGTFNLFGFDSKTPHDMALNALLVDGETLVEQDLTEVSIKEKEEENGSLILYVEASTPEKLPDVKPEGGSDSGFDADVDEWGDSQVEELPI